MVYALTKEHVWMSPKGFEEYEIGDSVSFFADVYRYVKTSNGNRSTIR